MTKPQRTCSVDGCGRPRQARGWCKMHWARWRSTGDPLGVRSRFKPFRTCSIASCERKSFCRGWCSLHYTRWRNNGDPLVVQAVRGPIEERLRFYTDQRGPDECWPWTGNKDLQGYGRVNQGRGLGLYETPAHRAVWISANEREVPPGMQIDHECHNRAVARGECGGGPTCSHRLCVNPSHLVPRTPLENTLRGNGPGAINARKTHCVHGHEFTFKNTRRITGRNGRPERVCIACERGL